MRCVALRCVGFAQVELKECFEDRAHYYLVMELCVGGELMDRIVAHTNFTEKVNGHVAHTHFTEKVVKRLTGGVLSVFPFVGCIELL